MRRQADKKTGIRLLLFVMLGCGIIAAMSRADSISSQPPINYRTAPTDDPVARLQRQIDAGQITLSRDDRHGYLSAILKALGVPVSSQMLVFSKTSFQRELIAPWRPRALYFNSDVYVGWVQGSNILEFASVDKQLGPIFYTLNQRQVQKPQFDRQNDNCLQCHDGLMTDDVPGLMMRSVFADAGGMANLSAANYLTTLSSPFTERWGGWYVTGSHGSMRHMGNMLLHSGDDPDQPDLQTGANTTDLSSRFDTSAYLAPGSDLVALMVLTHQTQVHNLITRANYQTRIALRDEKTADHSSGDAPGPISDSMRQRIQDACEPLVRALLFCEETPLPSPIAGTSTFARDFAAAGPRDKKGRSLRDFDLTRRLFKYPCSYLIYTESFAVLPSQAKDYVYQRLWDVLSGKETSQDFAVLSPADRKAVIEILRDTMSGLPEYWRTAEVGG